MIGLLKLPTPIESHPFVAPIKLNTVCNENFDNEYVTVAGRGLQSIEYQQPDQQIRHVQLQVLPYDECVARTDQYPADTLICALPNEGRSVYSGDSGILEFFFYLILSFCLFACILHAFHSIFRGSPQL